MFLCFLLVELETNWWFLERVDHGDSESYEVPNPQLSEEWKPFIVLLKFVIMSVNAFTFIFNTFDFFFNSVFRAPVLMPSWASFG